MMRAGRFLWLKLAHARLLPAENSQNSICAEHNGYSHLGVAHQRKMTRSDPNNWRIEDTIRPSGRKTQTIRFVLHWLLPDWPWEFDSSTLKLRAPCGQITLTVKSLSSDRTAQTQHRKIQLIRAGETLFGPAEETGIFGWFSPTYGLKVPALSLRFHFRGTPPFRILSEWLLSATQIES